MRILIVCLYACIVGSGCSAPFSKNSFAPTQGKTQLGLIRRSVVRTLVQPSEMFVNAFFKYREHRGEWPAEFTTLRSVKEFDAAYNDLFTGGMYQLNFQSISKDSLLLNFLFSKSKYAKAKGYDNTYIPDLVKGTYIFYYEKGIKNFTVKL